MSYGVIVWRPDGELESWGTDSFDQWERWCQRLFDECERYQNFEYFAFCM